MSTKPQGPGRPSLGERVPLGLRVTSDTKRLLDQAATASGRSQSQEAELRLEQTFSSASTLFDALDLANGRHWTGLLLAMAQVGQLTGTRAISASQFNFDGCEDWVSDPYAYDQAVRAIAFVLESFRPHGKIVRPTETYGLSDEVLDRLGEGFAREVLADITRRADRQDDTSILRSTRQRLSSIIGRVRIPSDVPLGAARKTRK